MRELSEHDEYMIRTKLEHSKSLLKLIINTKQLEETKSHRHTQETNKQANKQEDTKGLIRSGGGKA